MLSANLDRFPSMPREFILEARGRPGR